MSERDPVEGSFKGNVFGDKFSAIELDVADSDSDTKRTPKHRKAVTEMMKGSGTDKGKGKK